MASISTSPPFHIPLSRRKLLASLLAASAGGITRSVYAEALTLTPPQTEGPFYPDHLPLNQDNDLVARAEGAENAAGIVAEFGGRLLNLNGEAVADAGIELWQTDVHGCYLHSRGMLGGKNRDPLFQGYGKIRTNARGEYRFRTILPGLYTGRTRHFHIAVKRNQKRLLTTQLYVAGEPQNERDGVLNHIKDPGQRLSVIREFTPPTPDSSERWATWDIVLGHTPEDS